MPFTVETKFLHAVIASPKLSANTFWQSKKTDIKINKIFFHYYSPTNLLIYSISALLSSLYSPLF